MCTKKAFVSLFAIIVVAPFAFAQQGPPRQGPPTKEERLTHLKEQLELTQEQVEKIETILASTQKEIEKEREEEFADRQEHQEAMKKIHDKEDEEIEKLLTDEQKKIFAEMKKEREKRHRREMHERPSHD